MPALDIPNLANNLNFQAIEILAGSLATGQSLSLILIGTASTANLVYVFTGAFTIRTGATLSVAPKVNVQIDANVAITDNGALNVGSGATFVFEVGYETTTQIQVNGTMTATGSTFNLGSNDYSNTLIQVDSGGELIAAGSTFGVNQLVFASGSIIGPTDLNNDTFNTQVYFEGSQPTLSGSQTLLLGGSTGDALYALGNNGNKPSTLTIGSGVTIQGGSGSIGGYYSGDSVVFDGSLVANTPGGIVTLGGGGSSKTLQSYTALTASNGGTINIPESLQINGSAIVTVSPSSSLTVGGNLLGNTQNPALFNPQGTVTLNGAGTAAAPELLEAMSADLGSGPTGFINNFAYGTLQLSANTYVSLVDNAENSPGNTPEALYVNTLIVPAGATLNLDGLHLYAQTEQVNGTIISKGAAVSGEVYDDFSDSESFATGDPGFSGWTVDLTNTATNSTYTTTTDANGLFSLTGVAAGTYTLSEVVQSGYVQTQPASPGTYTITLVPGQTVTGEDFGDYPTASIGGEAFNDLNGDGTLESGEPGLSGWTVQLLNSSNAVIATATTNSSGDYSFTSLLPGTYAVQVVSQSGYVATSPASVTLTDDNGQADTVNFGEFVPVTVGGEVFNDVTGSGTYASGDQGLSGWTIDLLNSADSVVASAQTDANGNYTLTGVGPGTYTVEEVPRSDYVQTTAPATYSVTAAEGQNSTSLNFGDFQLATVSGEVYNDLDDSGVLNANDLGLSGWTVEVLNGSNQIIASVTTDSNGLYSFSNLAPGTYTIVDVLQAGYVQTAPASGSFSIITSSGARFSDEDFGATISRRSIPYPVSPTPARARSATRLTTPTHTAVPARSPSPSAPASRRSTSCRRYRRSPHR